MVHMHTWCGQSLAMTTRKTQAKITAFVTGSSSSDTPDNNETEATHPVTKKSKHRDSGFDPAWRDEFTTKTALLCFALSAGSTIKQPRGWFESKRLVVCFVKTSYVNTNAQNVTWIPSVLSLTQQQRSYLVE